MTSQLARAANRRGILTMAGGMACFVTNDSLVKLASASLPTAQLILLRGIFATLLLAAICQGLGLLRQAHLLLDRRVALRAGFDAFGTAAYLTSLFHLPIGNATAINMAAPLVITLMAVVFLGERVGARRWLAMATGFAGVLLVVQPSGAGFNAYALLCLAGTVLHSGRDLTTRVIAQRVPSLLVTLSSAIGVMVLAAVWALGSEWRTPTAGQLALLAAAAGFLSAGYYLVIVSMRSGDLSVIAPFRYTGLLFALVLGYLVWGDVPDALAWAGIALLVAAGLYVVHDERRRG